MRTNTHAEMKLHKGNIFRYYRQLHFHWTLIVLVHIKRHLGKTVYCRYLLCSLYNGKNRLLRNGRYVQFSFFYQNHICICSFHSLLNRVPASWKAQNMCVTLRMPINNTKCADCIKKCYNKPHLTITWE